MINQYIHPRVNKVTPKLIAVIILSIGVMFMSLYQGASTVDAQEAPAQCAVEGFGAGPGRGPCDGVPGVQPGKCYRVIVGNPFTVNEVGCDTPPFGGASLSGGVVLNEEQSQQREESQAVLNQTRSEITDCNPDERNCLEENPLVEIIKLVINFLGALVGVIVIAVIIMAGIQFSASGDNPNATAAAKKRIVNAIIALVAYMFLYAGLQWLIPGGIF